MSERDQLLKQIQMYEFALTDVGLYLDSHPTCKNALAYFEKYQHLHHEAMERYQALHGPIHMHGNKNSNYWTWVNNPWPWELEA